MTGPAKVAFAFPAPLLSLQQTSTPGHDSQRHQHTYAPAVPASARTPRAAADSNNEKSAMMADFDRNYYDRLKAKYADDPNITIYSKDDYTLDPEQVPWLYDNRGRDLDELREKVRKRVKEHEQNKSSQPAQSATPAGDNGSTSADIISEEKGVPDFEFPPDALQWTDLHSEEEIAEFNTRALTEDPVSGRVWCTPMTIDDLNHGDSSSSDSPADAASGFSKRSMLPETYGEPSWGDDEDDDDEPPLPGNLYYDDDDEAAALHTSFDHMKALCERDSKPITYGEADHTADPHDYQRWRREAEVRGGNAVVGDSGDLAPYRDVCREEEEYVKNRRCELAPQHDALVSEHVGLWSGTVSCFSVELENQFHPSLTSSTSIQTEVSHCDEDSLHFDSTISDSSSNEEVLSSVEFSTSAHTSVVARGRGVSSDGSYMLVPPEDGFMDCGFSLGAKTLSKLTGDSDRKCYKPVVEFGIISQRKNSSMRHRVFLLADGPRPDVDKEEYSGKRRSSKTKPPKFSYVILVSEVLCTSLPKLDLEDADPVDRKLPTISLSRLCGKWSGGGTIVHPEYPPEGVRRINTQISISNVHDLTEEDVSWTEDQFSDDPLRPSKRRERQGGKKKVSRRVGAARSHDHARLSRCSLISKEQTGDDMKEEAYAWQSFPSSNPVSWLFSPRLGRFADDYCGVVLTNDLILTFPYPKAFPSMWNVISLQELTDPTRRRLIAGRSAEGKLVGALFTTEDVKDSTTSDAVSSYV